MSPSLPTAVRKRGSALGAHVRRRAITRFVRWVREMSNKELETFGGLRARLVVGAILRLAPTALNRRRAARVRHTAIEWRVTIPGGDASVHTMVITEGRARVRRGIVAEPNMTLTIDTADFLRLVAGMENGAALFMGGRVKIEGDPTVALSLARLFRMPRA